MFLAIISPSSSCSSYFWNERNVRHFFFTTKTTQPRPQVFSVNGAFTCSGLHFWRHFLIKHIILPNLVIRNWLWWIIRVLLADQNWGNILNELQTLLLYDNEQIWNLHALQRKINCRRALLPDAWPSRPNSGCEKSHLYFSLEAEYSLTYRPTDLFFFLSRRADSSPDTLSISCILTSSRPWCPGPEKCLCTR